MVCALETAIEHARAGSPATCAARGAASWQTVQYKTLCGSRACGRRCVCVCVCFFLCFCMLRPPIWSTFPSLDGEPARLVPATHGTLTSSAGFLFAVASRTTRRRHPAWRGVVRPTDILRPLLLLAPFPYHTLIILTCILGLNSNVAPLQPNFRDANTPIAYFLRCEGGMPPPLSSEWMSSAFPLLKETVYLSWGAGL
eukprot:TRINITY_DN44117_c0_g1_i1.p1 TRINITY_DN44117_c0_g1~~TRINITY_DN44117_c0_g1_i1.p1  ORF type:complete len:198 (+),score=10.67 TRINITY_DN44117_c0_g1_i1:110-703(+)